MPTLFAQTALLVAVITFHAHPAHADGAPPAVPTATTRASAEEPVWKALRDGHCVLVMRHALREPGEGELPNFSVEDRSTQRNLTPAGVDQARAAGKRLKDHGIAVAAVFSSPYFRCQETATHAFGTTRIDPALSALPADPAAGEEQTAKVRQRVQGWDQKANLVLVTHVPNIQALTGREVPMGGILVLKPGKDRFEVVGTLLPPDGENAAMQPMTRPASQPAAR